MPLPPLLHARFVRIAAIVLSIWATSAVLKDVVVHANHADAVFFAWFAGYLVYAVAVWLSFTSGPWQTRRWRIALLAVQGAAPFYMATLIPCYYGGVLLVIVAWQAALLLPIALASLWVAAQIAAMTLIVCAGAQERDLGSVVAFVGFQVFALITAVVTRREATARAQLAQVNAELRATRAILAESSRLGERMRIARDLHDTMGHHLTALGLNLEVASHAPPEKSAEHLEKAKAITRDLLTDVREVVSELRSSDGVDVRRVLETLVRDPGALRIDLRMPADLRIECPDRAQALVRCVQEIVTNTRKHACARTLTICIAVEGAAVAVRAHDDGRGAREVRAGHGLVGMRERFERIGGHVRAGARPEGGFAVDAWLPLAGGAA